MSKFSTENYRALAVLSVEYYEKWAKYLYEKHGVIAKGKYASITKWHSALFRKAIDMALEGEINTDDLEIEI